MTGSLSADAKVTGLESVRRALGDESVIDSERELAKYHDPFTFGPDGAFLPSAVVRPRSVPEVQELVRIANEHRMRLWVVSTGRNYGYGGAAPCVGGTVVVDLSRMNRVLEVDEDSAYAVVEPGVRFTDLYQHLRAGGYRLWTSVPALGWGSVLANALERGVGRTPHGDHGSMICGMEVVLPTGELVRTGMGGIEGTRLWQLYRPGFGPSHDGLFMQSNFGIVTKLGIWLMPTPECFRTCSIMIGTDEDAAAFVDIARSLTVTDIVNSRITVSHSLFNAATAAPRAQWYDGPGSMPEGVVAETLRKLDLGTWEARFALYGTREMVDTRFREVERAIAGIGGLKIVTREYDGDVGEADLDPRDLTFAGVPTVPADVDDLQGHMRIIQWRGGQGAHVDFTPIAPASSADFKKQLEIMRARLREYGFDYMARFSINGRYMLHIFMLVYDKSDDDQRRAAYDVLRQMLDDMSSNGYSVYRAHVALMDTVAQHFSFNDYALARLNTTIKDALDPKGVLSPGKQGVWPSSGGLGSDL